MTIGEKIQNRRKKAGLSKEQLAMQLNVSKQIVSKWECDELTPEIDQIIMMSELFNVSTDYLLKEYEDEGIFDEADYGNEYNEEISITHKVINFIIKQRFIFGVIALIIAVMSLGIDVIYYLIVKPKGYVFIFNDLFYYFLSAGIAFLLITMALLVNTNQNIRVRLMKIGVILGILLAIFLPDLKNSSIKETVQFSPNKKSALVLKENTKTNEMSLYRQSKGIFAYKSDDFVYSVDSKLKTQWLTNDICAITYKSNDNNIHQYIATYGKRDRGISYLNPIVSINGNWQTKDKNSTDISLKVNSEGIFITIGADSYQYQYNDCVPFGTTAIALCNNGIPKWTIALNEDCIIDSDNLIAEGGTITLCEVSMNKTKAVVLKRISLSESNLEKPFEMSTSKQNEFYIYNNEIRFTTDFGKSWHKVDVLADEKNEMLKSFANSSDNRIPSKQYYISEDGKTLAFLYGEYAKLCISTNGGKTWETLYVDKKLPTYFKTITQQIIGFTSSQDGYIAIGTDYTPGSGYDRDLFMTNDGGKTWAKRSFNNPSGGHYIDHVIFLNKNIGTVSFISTYDNYDKVFPVIYFTKDSANSWFEVNFDFEQVIKEYGDGPYRLSEFRKVDDQYEIVFEYNGNQRYQLIFKSNNLENWEFFKKIEIPYS